MKKGSDKDFEILGDEALEARVVAWVLGEASEFEADELRRLCGERPELEVFRCRIAAVHGLAGEAVRKPSCDWKLAEAKRAKVLALAGAAPTDDEARRDLTSRHAARRMLWSIAACFILTVVVAGLLVPQFLRAKKGEAPVGEKSASVCYFAASSPEEAEASAKHEEMVNLEKMLEQPPERLNAARPIRFDRAGAARQDQEASVSRRLRSRGTRSADVPPVAEPPADSPPVADRSIKENEPPRHSSTSIVRSKSARPKPKREPMGSSGGSFGLSAKVPAASPAPAAKPKKPTAPSSSMAKIVEKNIDAPIEVPAIDAKPGAIAAGFGTEDDFKDEFDDGDGDETAALAGRISGKSDKSYMSDWSEESDKTARPAAISSASERLEDTAHGGLKRDLSREEMTEGKLAENGERVPTLGDVPLIARLFKEKKKTVLVGGALNTNTTEGGAWEMALNRSGGKAPVVTSEETRRLDLNGRMEDEDDEKLAQVRQSESKAVEGQVLGGESGQLPDKVSSVDVALDLMAEVSAAKEPYSTFSLHVSDASFRVARAALARGERPAPEKVRPEEFYNAFDYGDPAPTAGEPVACATEQCRHPVLPGRNLVRIAVRAGSVGRGAGQPLRLTVLLDNSGSMEREDRRAALGEAVRQLASLLGPADVVSVIGFARTPRLLGDRMDGATAAGKLAGIVDGTPSEGGTNLEAALALAGEVALRQFAGGAQNRIVLLTDGAANLGNANPDSLAKRIESLRRRGVAFDAAGFGTAGMNDTMLERLTRDGNGRYYVVDRVEDAGPAFAAKLAGAFRPAAENVKVQVRFNPQRVGRYRLIGFEKHRLKKEDFRNDAVDAAELAAEEAGVALYQVELLPGGEGEIGEVGVRFRNVAVGRMVERHWTLAYDENAPPFDKASPSIQLAGTAALLADVLRDGPLAPLTDWRDLAPVLSRVNAEFSGNKKVEELVEMIGKVR